LKQHSHFKASWVTVEDGNVQGDKAPAKLQKMLKYLRTHPRRQLLNNPWARKHCLDQLWNFPGDLNRKFECALHCSFITTMRPHHTSLKTTEFVTDNNMVIISHPLYLLDLAPCYFALLPKLKWNWRDYVLKQCLTAKGNQSQAVLESIKENDFHGAFEAWKKTMGSLYMFLMRLFWRWQPKLSKLSQHFFFDPDREPFRYTSYNSESLY
jgi:hypothetical protein